MVHRWRLTAGAAYIGGASAAALAVTREDGSPAVLKVGYPHREARFEAVGLEAMAPIAPRVLDQDPWTWSLLLERVVPGTPLSRSSDIDGGLERAGALHARVVACAPPPGIPTLAGAMDEYVRAARGRWAGQVAALRALGVENSVEAAIDELTLLEREPAPAALLHGDFNPGNLLEHAESGGLLAIDPKPLLGDPAYDLWPLIAQLGHPFESHDPVATIRAHLERACRAAGCAPERVARWSRARTGLNVSWYLAQGDPAQARQAAFELSVWNRLLGA
nr:aminoglycoside phosphotransferase family protein [Galbitalea soli]